MCSGTHANPTHHHITFTCPNPQVISNFADYLAGYGVERIFNDNRIIYYKSTCKPNNIPASVEGYNHTGASYDVMTAQISCTYGHNKNENKPFTLVYNITNGSGGIVTAKTNNVISVQFPIGLR